MKQISFTFLLTVLMSIVEVKALAHDIEVKNADGVTIYYNYTKDNTALSVTYRGDIADSYSERYSGSIVIPESVTYDGNTYSVTAIGDEAFYMCSNLISVIIPNSVTSIDRLAFCSCGLKSVTIGSGVLSIASYAFDYTHPEKVIWLTNTPPSGYQYVNGKVNYVANEQYALSNTTVYPFLSSMFEVDGVKYVPVSPSERTCDAIDCVYNESAKNIHIDKTVTNMGISLTVQQIHPYAFYSNKYIKNVELELDGDVGDYAFYGCTDLENAILGEQITSLGDGIFGECYKLQSITIPDAVQTLGSNAFWNCI